MQGTNRCACCNRFRSWEDLVYQSQISYVGAEDEWYECTWCIEAEKKDEGLE